MWFRRLEYPRAQTYAIPYITECFYAVSAILIALLVTLNVVLVGNDVVTTLKKDPNNIESKWWAPKWIPSSLALATTPGPCQPFRLPQHATSVRTTSDLPLFAYTILNGLSRPQNGSLAWLSSLPYRSESLQNCTVQNMTALINFQDRGHRVTSQILCRINSTDHDTPSVIKLSTTFSRMANTDLGSDDIVDYISSYAVPQSAEISKAQAVIVEDSTPALKMLGVLDAIGSDMLKAFWALKWTRKLAGREGDWPDQGVVKWSTQANCSIAANGTSFRCRNEGERVEGIDTWYSNTKGAQDFNVTYFRGMNATIYNYMVVLRDALHLDLGNIDPQNNVFLNETAFKSRIIPDPYMSLTAPLIIGKPRPGFNGPYTPDQFWRTCTWGWGCQNGTWTEAILNKAPIATSITSGLPISSLENSSSIAIDVDYVCPVFRAKPIGSLLVSVFIGTFSMYTALYGIFLFVMPKLDEMYRRKHGLRRFSLDDEEDWGRQYDHIIYPYQTPPQTADPYTKASDGLRRYSTDSASRYDPIPNSNLYRPTSREGSSLPPGAYLPATGTAAPPSDVLLPSEQVVYVNLHGPRDPRITSGQRSAAQNSVFTSYYDPYSASVSELQPIRSEPRDEIPARR